MHIALAIVRRISHKNPGLTVFDRSRNYRPGTWNGVAALNDYDEYEINGFLVMSKIRSFDFASAKKVP